MVVAFLVPAPYRHFLAIPYALGLPVAVVY